MSFTFWVNIYLWVNFVLFTQYGGGPSLSENEYCTDCIKDEAKTIVSTNSYRDKILSVKDAVEVVLTGRYLDGNWYYVSRTWQEIHKFFHLLFTLAFMFICFVICLLNQFLSNILLIQYGIFLFDIYEGSTLFLLPNFKLRNFGQCIRVIVFSCKMIEAGLNRLWLFLIGSFGMLE